MESLKMISVSEASQILQVSERQVRRYCNDGKLASEKDGKAFSIELGSVRELLRSNEPLEEESGHDEYADIFDEDIEEMSKPDVRISENGNGHVRNGMSDNAQHQSSDENEFRVRIEAINRTLDQFLDSQQKQAGQIKGTLGELFTSYADEKTKTRKTTTTLTGLLDDISDPSH
jgi:hypothetical protein